MGFFARWDLKKKRQELDIAIAQEFHKLYGEFKDAARQLEWTYVTPQYHLYNDAAGRVACLIAKTEVKRQRDPKQAMATLRSITDVRTGAWDDEVKAYRVGEGRRA